MVSVSLTPSLTPSRSPSPCPPVQPDHFYGTESIQLPPSPDSDGKTWLSPDDDPLAHRGIPVFKPTMEEFQDFEAYMTKVEQWGMKSGIVKVIPPKEWSASLPSLEPQLRQVQIKTPIEQHMFGRGGLFRQENLEKRKFMSVREWVELCSKDDFRAPGVQEVGLHSRSANVKIKTRKTRKAVKAESAGPGIGIKEEPLDDYHQLANIAGQPPLAEPITDLPPSPASVSGANVDSTGNRKNGIAIKAKPKAKGKRTAQTKEIKEANLAERAARDLAFLDTFDPHQHWLPPNTKAFDYTPEFCQKLERQYWRNLGLGKPAWYGADTQGSLYTDETKSWNVAHLPSTLSRLLPSSDKGLPGVNTPYLYFGMWRATFAWHVEDMDLFSINYIHFGAPKFWYAIPQGRSCALEQTMRGYFPKDTSQCPQFLRHKSFLASPNILAQSSCRPNFLVQHSGEFVITFPRGYHAGFNLGLNCAESVNFALDSWLEFGRNAKACKCISDSVRIDVDQLLADRSQEANSPTKIKLKRPMKAEYKSDFVKQEVVEVVLPSSNNSRKRKSEGKDDGSKIKRIKLKTSPSNITSSQPNPRPTKMTVTLKLGPRPIEPEAFPCCLCISMDKNGLLKVQDPPISRKDAMDAAGGPKVWMAHENCANVVPETWVDEVESQDGHNERVVFGVDGIVKDRWNLKCSACTKNRSKAHGAPVQCTKGKCPKAFHVSCAKDGIALGVVYDIIREVEKEVVLLDSTVPSIPIDPLSGLVPVNIGGQADDMQLDVPPVALGSRVLKIIKKLEVQILCAQHNPAVAAAKKANKQDKIRNDLMALSSMARIKIRVSAGVFEVSLVRVIEESKSVEVLWDRGLKREFKWGSVVFGNTDGPVLQKPSEPAVEPERPISVMPVPTYPSVFAATGSVPGGGMHSTVQNSAAPHQYATQYMYPYDYWSYTGQGLQHGSAQATYPYGFYSSTQGAGPSQTYNPYAYMHSYNQTQYRGGQLHWQQPYQGPQRGLAANLLAPLSVVGQTSISQIPIQAQSSISEPLTSQLSAPLPSTSHAVQPVEISDPKFNGFSNLKPVVPTLDVAVHRSDSVSQQSQPPSQPVAEPPSGLSEAELALFNDLTTLSSLQPSQIADVLRSNPRLRDIVWAAVDQAKKVNA